MTNRLAQSQSLYLRKHAENPIDWRPWDEEALDTARRENKPIFLSIGYSSCHWCTVMEGEAFSDLAIAQYMNANFVPIKVDREERPDLDSIYMQALQMMTGQGGWPLNIFLSPEDLVPFYGGTYFPLEPRYGRPGFLQVLQSIRRFYDTETAKMGDLKAELQGLLQQAAVLSSDGNRALDWQDLLEPGIESNTGVLTARGYGPSFPMMPYAELALRGTRFTFDSRYDAKETCTQRGLDLALGGIYDHLAGGFHRYTVDDTWTVPHFEKMLYDNGQIVEFLANLWATGVQEPAFERAIAGTYQWLKREMTAPEGYFYAAQDADSFADSTAVEPEEGAFYVWSYAELEQILSRDELAELAAEFTVNPDGNFEGSNVLQRRHAGQLSDSLEVTLKKLFAVRYGESFVATFPPARDNREAKTGNWPGRIPPVTDTKAIAAWNSLMISGLARAYSVFGHPEYLELAVGAAKFILDRQLVDGRFHRLNYDGQPAVLAQSEDYALFIKALLDLHQASLISGLTSPPTPLLQGEVRKIPPFPTPLFKGSRGDLEGGLRGLGQSDASNFWLEKAVSLQDEFDEFLWSLELGGYYNTAADRHLIVRERSYIDNATPSANGVAIANLVRLFLLTENLPYLDRAEQTLQAFSSMMERSPQACPSLFSAVDWYLHPTLIRTSNSEISSMLPQYLPTAMLKLESDLSPNIFGFVCQGLSCQEPATSREQLWQQVQQLQSNY
jgi:hypothetical protein